jgi:putative sterol carrier protein
VLDLERGACRGVLFTTDEFEIDDAPFVIEASYAQWKAIIKRELDPILAMLSAQLRLRKGHLPTLIKDVEGSKQLVLSASQVDTEFLD